MWSNHLINTQPPFLDSEATFIRQRRNKISKMYPDILWCSYTTGCARHWTTRTTERTQCGQTMILVQLFKPDTPLQVLSWDDNRHGNICREEPCVHGSSETAAVMFCGVMHNNYCSVIFISSRTLECLHSHSQFICVVIILIYSIPF